MSGTSNPTYYNYNNLEDYCRQQGVAQPLLFLRWTKDILDTKVSMFRYKQLPNSLTSEIIERALLFNNYLCFYDMKELGGLILCRWRPNSMYDLYWKPTHVDLLTISGKTIATGVPYEDIVPFRDNPMDIIPFITLKEYIDKCIEIEKTLEHLTKLVRLPVLLSGSKEQVGMLRALLKKVDIQEDFMIGNKGLKDVIDQYDIKLPCTLDELFDLMRKYEQKALASIGIYSSDEKRERLITAEIQASNDFTDFVYTEMVEERKNALKLVKEKWGYDIELEETYVLNREDDIALTREETKAIEEEKAKAQNLIENNQGGNE